MTAGLFDGTVYPRVKVMAGNGDGGAMREVTVTTTNPTYALRSYARTFGRSSPIDSADPGQCTLVWNNGSGEYDSAFTNRVVNSGFEVDTAGWFAGASTTIARTTAAADTGAASLNITRTGTTGTAIANTAMPDGGQGPGFWVTAGEQITARARMRAVTTARTCTARLEFYTPAGVSISAASGTGVADSTGAWTTISVTTTVPANATQAHLELQVASAVATEVHRADSISVHTGPATTQAVPNLDIGTPIQVFMEWPAGTSFARFEGTIRKFSVDAGLDATVTWLCADGLEKLGRTPSPNELRVLHYGTRSGQQIAALADVASWDAFARIIDTGSAYLHATMQMGDSILSLMQKVEMTEQGFLFVSEGGDLTFWDRYHSSTATRSTTVQLTLADTSAAGTLGMVELVTDRSTDRVYNDIHAIRDADPAQDPELTGTEPGDVPVERSAQDLVSIGTAGGRYGYLSLPAEVGKLHNSDAGVADHVNMLLAWFSLPAERIEQVTINGLHPLVKANNLTDELLGLTLLDRISVSRDYGPRTIAGQLHVQQLTEEVDSDPPGWTITLTTANPTSSLDQFILGTDILGTDRIGY